MARSSSLVLICMLGSLLGIGGCGGREESPAPPTKSYGLELAERDGLRMPARVQGPSLELAMPSGFEARFWPGVNIGATTPGHSPGEVAVSGEDFHRWLPEIAAAGARVIRVYTLLDPSFYRELAAYNESHPDAPLYVLH